MLDAAREERERLELATETLKKENDRTEKLAVERALGGSADAGDKPEAPKEESDLDYSKRLMAGDIERK